MSPHPDRDRKLPRLKDFDYSTDGAYFVTICTANREQIFGKICDGKMILNEFGKITEKCWRDLPNHYSNCVLDEFVVMPNHFHGIIWIENNFDPDNGKSVGNGHARSLQETVLSLPKKTNLSTVIGSFKSATTKIIRQQNSQIDSGWQKSFFDRIIRDEDELNRIRDYIWQNPENWEKDEENLKC
ncbi:MAG: transposase [Patescibacteria group bacterium]